jgi:hypothetical protein
LAGQLVKENNFKINKLERFDEVVGLLSLIFNDLKKFNKIQELEQIKKGNYY